MKIIAGIIIGVVFILGLLALLGLMQYLLANLWSIGIAVAVVFAIRYALRSSRQPKARSTATDDLRTHREAEKALQELELQTFLDEPTVKVSGQDTPRQINRAGR